MSATVHDLLEKHFETAFAAPDGIQKLRELILTLAMQGKLVEQDPNDPPAGELLKEIEAEKQRLIQEGKIKKPKKLPPIKPEEVPYELPQGWEWVRLGDIVLSITGGGTPSKNNPTFWGGDIPWASVKDLNVETYLDSTIDSITEKAIASSSTKIIPKGRVIICTRMGLGKIAINRIAVAINQDLKALRISSHVDQMFFVKKYKNYKITGSGMTVHGIRQDELLNFLFPLPPLPEQHRIVKRIDQLMARCNALEKLRKEREAKRLTVHAAAIKQLLDADPSFPRRRESSSSKELAPRLRGGDEKGCGSDGVCVSAWNFLKQHFGELYSVKENVAELRKAILQLAVMGRLVPQNPNDPPASELLKEIEAEKQRLIQEGKIKKPKKLPPIQPEEVPYQLPQGWAWVRLGDIGSWKSGSTPSRSNKSFYGGDIPWVKSGEVKQGRIKSTEETITQEALEKCPLRINKKGSVLVAMYGANIGDVGILEIEAATNQAVCACMTYTNINENYLLYLITSLKRYFLNQGAGAAQPNISREKIVNTIFPLPPLPEQHRIVKRIDQLMALCDRLEQQIDAATGKQTELLGAVMAQV